MMEIRLVYDKAFPDFDRLEALYTRSFPDNERCPIEKLMGDQTKHILLMGFYEDGQLCGMGCLLNTTVMAHLIYLTVEESARGRGIGSRILQAVHAYCPGKRVIVDVEQVRDDCPNREQREKRMRFYEKNGYAQTEVHYPWRGDTYVILSHGGQVTGEDWHKFWRELEKYVDTDPL